MKPTTRTTSTPPPVSPRPSFAEAQERNARLYRTYEVAARPLSKTRAGWRELAEIAEKNARVDRLSAAKARTPESENL